jgi:hypothetical protein
LRAIEGFEQVARSPLSHGEFPNLSVVDAGHKNERDARMVAADVNE